LYHRAQRKEVLGVCASVDQMGLYVLPLLRKERALVVSQSEGANKLMLWQRRVYDGTRVQTLGERRCDLIRTAPDGACIVDDLLVT
jgi:hypothetical protein